MAGQAAADPADPAEIALDAGDSSSEDDGASAAKRARLLDES